MFCSKCGAAVSGKFCCNCGEQIPHEKNNLKEMAAQARTEFIDIRSYRPEFMKLAEACWIAAENAHRGNICAVDGFYSEETLKTTIHKAKGLYELSKISFDHWLFL